MQRIGSWSSAPLGRPVAVREPEPPPSSAALVPAATITINRWAKPELWTEQERAEPALYAHKVTVDRAHAGQGLGAELLDWAGTKAADEGADWLRVDVWTTNEHLQHYYLRQGFTYVRTVVLPHNPSGALFQRPAERVPTPHLQEAESLTG
jgi:GNAT superfamily N-acetyltransferase